MANSITLAKKYIPLLDEVYQNAILTADLESDASLARDGANTNEIIIPKMTMQGLADYSRNSGYVSGDMTLTWETVQFNYERGRMFSVDAMDNEETQDVAFGMLGGEFIRTKVVGEVDAFRFATYASKAPSGNVVTGTLSDGAGVISAIRELTSKQDEAQVNIGSRYLYITPTLYGLIQDMDTTKSREVLARFAKVVQVPQVRFYSAIDLYDGTTEGEENGGYAKASTGKDINFMIVEKSAVMQYTKHALPKIVDPETNQDADAWKYGSRNYGLADVYDNKADGIALHTKA